jgi:diguanylate cyclase (GGDEF)-like protein
MKSASRIALVYLLVSTAWLMGIGRLCGALPLSDAPLDGSLQTGVFLLLSSSLIYILVRREWSRRDRIERDLRHQAVHDPLTGLINRACFLEMLDKGLAVARRTERRVGVVFVDLDGFKQVNDTHGHRAGDGLLVEVARRIQGVVRAGDCAARFGGDEFVVLVQDDHEHGCKRLAERLVDALRAPILIEGMRVTLTASVGFAIYPDHGMEGDHLLRAADMAMYRVKEHGKNAAKEAFSTAA